jgi:non-ribosomal peptide synthetase component F
VTGQVTRLELDVTSMQFDNFCRPHAISRATVIRLAWGLVLRAFTGSSQICFGYRTENRNFPECQGIANAVGSFESVIACILDLRAHKSLPIALRAAEDSFHECLNHQQVVVPEIEHVLGLKGERLFNTCLAFQDEPLQPKNRFATNPALLQSQCVMSFDTADYDISASAMFVEGRLVADISHRIITTVEATNIANAFERAVQLILLTPDGSVGGLNLFTDRDYAQLLEWDTGDLAPLSESNVHSLIIKTAKCQPDAPAICSWDGEFSYRQLMKLSSRLSHYLIGLGLAPGDAVPLVLEKTRWSVVAMLAVLK